MIRKITRPSTARCTLPMYISFLLGEPNYGSCCRLSNVMTISHASANRFLHRERYEGKDWYNESAPLLNLKGGTLSVDDCVLDKPYSQYLAFVGYFWSGKHKRSVKGINLITLYYTDLNASTCPSTSASMTSRKARPRMTTSATCWKKSWPGDWNRLSSPAIAGTAA